MSGSEHHAKGAGPQARPFACLYLSLVGLLATTLLLAASAQAAPPTPVLIKTDPGSPNTTLEPLVYGNSTGVIISAFPGLKSLAPGAAATAAGEGTVIRLYRSIGCEGEVVAEGTPAELDGGGIKVQMLANTTNHVSAVQADETGASNCSNAIQYVHVDVLPPPGGGEPPVAERPATKPPAAPRVRTVPGGIANDDKPLVTGTAPGAGSVRIYSDPDCKGQPVAKGQVAEFEAGFRVGVVPDDVSVFSGVAVNGAGASPCSQPVVYVEDSTAPRTRITMGPAAKTRKRVAVFRFRDVAGANLPGTVFRCKVDRRRWRKCVSPLKVKRLTRRKHVVRIRATDAAGNVERRGVTRKFKVLGPS